MPLTPEEEQELRSLEAPESSYHIKNVYGEDVSIPRMTEKQSVEAVHAAAGALPLGAPGSILKAAGGRGRQLLDYLSGKLAGLSPAGVKAIQSAPKTVQALANAPELRQQQFAKQAMQSASNALGSRAKGLSADLQGVLADKAIPETAVASAGEFAPKGLSDLITGKVPLKEVYKAAQVAGKEAKFANNPLVVGAQKARAEDAGKAFGVLRGAVGEAAPEANQIIAELEKGVNASKSLSKGQAKPLAYMTSKSPDIAASRQSIEGLLDSTRLGRTASQLGAAKELARPAEGLVPNLLKPVGVAGLRATAAAAPIARGAAEIAGATGSRLAGQAFAPEIRTKGLTPEEQQELQQLQNELAHSRE